MKLAIIIGAIFIGIVSASILACCMVAGRESRKEEEEENKLSVQERTSDA